MLVDNLSDLLIYTRIIKLGSLSAAGKDLGLSAAVVSKRLQRLESQLGTTLVMRSTRTLNVTEEGYNYFKHCKSILGAVEVAEADILSKDQIPRGTLKVSVPAYFGRLYIAPLIPEFLEKYSEVDLSLDFSDQFVDIIGGGYDLAVRIGDLQDSNLVVRKLGTDQRVIVASPEYIKRFGEPKSPKELTQHNVLIFSNPTPMNQWVFKDEKGKEYSVKVAGNFETNNCETLNNAVVSGLGITQRPMWDVWDAIQSGELVVLLNKYKAPKFDIQVVYPSRTNIPHKVRVFTELLKDHLGNDLGWNR
ncbi:MAG: LysR family transcriptional regulator [Gammaproteobacteria bacterium]|nr:LysR family transcriptional regulator [Gammaproteobacteria bacterium]